VGVPGRGGSLITRPEILTRALVHGGTTSRSISGCQVGHCRGDGAVAVTEPDFGSDVAGITTSRCRRTVDG